MPLTIRQVTATTVVAVTCGQRRRPSVVAYYSLINLFPVPVQSVWWSSPSSSSDGQLLWTVYKPNENLSFSEGELCHFTCMVNGSYPRPVVKVFIGSEDLTQYFTSSAVLIKGHGVRGLQPIYYRVELSNRSLNIDYRYNDKQLKCIANLPDADPALATSSTVFIRLTVCEYIIITLELFLNVYILKT